ncbi:MAG: hypothetical protein ACW990_00045 [Promethearchaeota archaeon]
MVTEDGIMKVIDDYNIFNTEGIKNVIEKIREHINYAFDNIDDDSVPMCVTIEFIIELVVVKPDEEDTENE